MPKKCKVHVRKIAIQWNARLSLIKKGVLMSRHRLSFGEIIILKPNLAEVIVDDGIEMDLKMVEEYHEFLLNKLIKWFPPIERLSPSPVIIQTLKSGRAAFKPLLIAVARP